jgi:hypothetical protein
MNRSLRWRGLPYGGGKAVLAVPEIPYRPGTPGTPCSAKARRLQRSAATSSRLRMSTPTSPTWTSWPSAPPGWSSAARPRASVLVEADVDSVKAAVVSISSATAPGRRWKPGGGLPFTADVVTCVAPLEVTFANVTFTAGPIQTTRLLAARSAFGDGVSSCEGAQADSACHVAGSGQRQFMFRPSFVRATR